MDKVDCYVIPQTSGTGRNIFQGGSPLSSSLPLLGVQLVLIVAVTRVLFFLLKPLKQPRVVSEIMGGIILGLSVLSRNAAFKQAVFPARGVPVLNTGATFGLMYVIFLIGVRMDPMLVVRSGKKGVVIGLSGFLLALAFTAAGSSGDSHDHGARHVEAVHLHVHACRLALGHVLCGAVADPVRAQPPQLGARPHRHVGVDEHRRHRVAHHGGLRPRRGVPRVARHVAMGVHVGGRARRVHIARRAPDALMVIERTPSGHPLDETYVFFLLIVLLVGLYSDIIGTNSFHGALMLGLAILDGPPLGEKIEAMVFGLILSLYYAMIGLSTDLWEMHWGRLQIIVFLGWLGKLVGVMASSLYLEIPLRDSVSLSLFMNSKGIVEVITFTFFVTNKVIN